MGDKKNFSCKSERVMNVFDFMTKSIARAETSDELTNATKACTALQTFYERIGEIDADESAELEEYFLKAIVQRRIKGYRR